MNISEADKILRTYNKEAFHIHHAETVSGVMRYFSKIYDPDREEFWAMVGLLHDIDFEEYPEKHCVKGEELLRDSGAPDELIRAAMSHGWGLTGSAYQPDLFMEKILFATDELTGLIGAAILMRPSRSATDLEVSSVRKKFKDKKFAAGCSRYTIQLGAEMLGWSLDELIEQTILAMRTLE